MKEARLESKVRVTVPDLGVTVMPGSPTWVDADAARKSACLIQLVRIGRVSVSFGKRCAVSKNPYPSRTGRMSRPAKGGMQKPFGNNESGVSGKGISTDDAEKLVADAASRAAQMAAQAVASQIKPVTGEEIRKAVLDAMEDAPGSAGRRVRDAGPEEPIFIPAGIVKSDASELDVSSVSSESSDLDEAAAALKALRVKATLAAMSGKKRK